MIMKPTAKGIGISNNVPWLDKSCPTEGRGTQLVYSTFAEAKSCNSLRLSNFFSILTYWYRWEKQWYSMVNRAWLWDRGGERSGCTHPKHRELACLQQLASWTVANDQGDGYPLTSFTSQSLPIQSPLTTQCKGTWSQRPIDQLEIQGAKTNAVKKSCAQPTHGFSTDCMQSLDWWSKCHTCSNAIFN